MVTMLGNILSQTVWAIIRLSKPHTVHHGACDEIFQVLPPFFYMGRSLGTRLLPIYICRMELLNISNWSALPQVQLIITDWSSERVQKMLSQSHGQLYDFVTWLLAAWPLECHGRVCQCKYCLHLHYSLLSWTSGLINPTIFGPVHFLDISSWLV